MASITNKRGNGRVWYAVWKVDGKNKFKSTDMPVAGNDSLTPAQAKALARQIAYSLEAGAKGTPVDKALDAVRAVAEVQGVATRVPTLREFLTGIPATTSESSEKNRRRSFNVFMEYLGADADRRIDAVTYNQCREFIREQLRQVSRKTVTQYHTYIMRAFADAQDIHGLITRNPMRPVSVAQEAKTINPERGTDKQEKETFTPQEMHRLLHEAPAPWCNIVAVSFYLGGLRIGDVCMMRWDAINWEREEVTLMEEKTKRRRRLPIIPALLDVLKRIRYSQGGREEYLFPMQAHMFLGGSRATVSTTFTALLQTMGIIPAPVATGKPTGRRKRISAKTFHSIRHTVVSMTRLDASFTPDMVRDAVGHSSEQVERGYFHGDMTSRKSVYGSLADSINAVADMPSYGKKQA
ncbi:MAG: tyrosine-type recombinase/integrase [Akkermansia sp.]|nr:tyrosine-type recombinase/integrase [Akkermansia sp.]